MTEAPPPAPRNPLGWIVLALLFVYLIFGATTRATKDTPQSRLARYTNELQGAMATYEAGDNPMARMLSGEAPDEKLREMERDLAPKHRTEAIESGFWGVVRRQLGEAVEPADLAPLGRDRDFSLLSRSFQPRRRSPEEARALAASLDRRGAASRLAADQVRREAGLPTRPRKDATARALLAGLLFLALLGGSALAWIAFFVKGLAGDLVFPGPALEARSGAEADGLAIKAATLLSAFLVLQIAAEFLIRAGLDERAGEALVYGAMLFVAVPRALRSRPTLAEVGLRAERLGHHLRIGLWAFLMEIPITGGIALVCALALKGLPQPEHPASTALMNSPDLWTIAVTFFGGAIVAPVWEETMFRGLLFPALRRVLKGPIPGALASSFLFASIHPQGPVLWAALASVALFSCFLAQKTRSLVPSVTMHFAHNAFLLTLTVLMGR